MAKVSQEEVQAQPKFEETEQVAIVEKQSSGFQGEIGVEDLVIPKLKPWSSMGAEAKGDDGFNWPGALLDGKRFVKAVDCLDEPLETIIVQAKHEWVEKRDKFDAANIPPRYRTKEEAYADGVPAGNLLPFWDCLLLVKKHSKTNEEVEGYFNIDLLGDSWALARCQTRGKYAMANIATVFNGYLNGIKDPEEKKKAFEEYLRPYRVLGTVKKVTFAKYGSEAYQLEFTWKKGKVEGQMEALAECPYAGLF